MVLITGITIEHIPKELSPNGSLDSAPKDIMLVVSRVIKIDLAVILMMHVHICTGTCSGLIFQG